LKRAKTSDAAATAPSARSKALGLLARREHSARELKAKLVQRGHGEREAAETVDELKGRKYQSDERFAESIARSRLRQGYGPFRIRAELKSHGLADTPIRVVIAALNADWAANAAAACRRQYGRSAAADAADRARRAQFLLRRGFDPATVRAVTRADVDDSGESD